MNVLKDKERLQSLSKLLDECADYDEDFQTCAVENEDYVRIALYAKNVTDGYAIASDKLLAECDKACEVLQKLNWKK